MINDAEAFFCKQTSKSKYKSTKQVKQLKSFDKSANLLKLKSSLSSV